ncbi:MAG: Fe-S cluster assembly ATPase SufC, partial [Methanobacteriota archaeon]
MLKIENLHVSIGGNQILKGINLEVKAGETHAIMGPNGSGKSTLAQVLAGHEEYEITDGKIEYLSKDLLGMDIEERACEGIFLAFQYPVELPGVNNTYFLKSALNAQRKYRGEKEMDAMEFIDLIGDKIKLLNLKDSLLKRPVNEGFSGGEKKRNEIFQMAVLEPKLALLDETDSGLDIDALRVVANGINSMRKEDNAIIIV